MPTAKPPARYGAIWGRACGRLCFTELHHRQGHDPRHGTLTDPKPGITRSIQYALNRLDRAAPTEDELTWCIGPPLRASLKKLVGTDDLADRALLLYRERFGDVGIVENEIYPGIEVTLSAFADSGRRLFVATSKPVVYAERIIDHFKLKPYFERVFGSELDGTRSDKTDLLGYALQTVRVDPAQATMIGDRSHDMVGARNNGMTAVGVLYGYGSEAELLAAGVARPRCLAINAKSRLAPQTTSRISDGAMPIDTVVPGK